MLRTTQSAIESLTAKLRSLRNENPRAFFEFVAIARDRKHVPIGDDSIRFLREKGWIEPPPKRGGWTAHDMMRHIVKLQVKGFGIELSIANPEHGTPHVHLPNGTVADKGMVDALALDFERLYETEPMAWAELVRMTRGYQKKPFGNTLQTLEDLSYVLVQKRQFSLPLGMGIMDASVVLIPRYVLELLPHCATNGTGLNFHPKKPYDEVCSPVAASDAADLHDIMMLGMSPLSLLMLSSLMDDTESPFEQLNDAFGQFP